VDGDRDPSGEQYFTVSLSAGSDGKMTGSPVSEERTISDPLVGIAGTGLGLITVQSEAQDGDADSSSATRPTGAQLLVHQGASSEDFQVGMSPDELSAFARMKTFCSSILKMLAPPLLREIKSSTKLSSEAEPFAPRRITHASTSAATLAIRPASKKASAAKTALLRTLGISPVNLAVDEGALEELRHFFDSPIHEQHLRAIAMIFGKAVPSAGQILEAERSPVCVH
jgi:hypothetical protein